MNPLEILTQLDTRPTRVEITHEMARLSGPTDLPLDDIEARATQLLRAGGGEVVVTRLGDGAKKTRAVATRPPAMEVVAHHGAGQHVREVIAISRVPTLVGAAVAELRGAPFVSSLEQFVAVASPTQFRVVRLAAVGFSPKGYGEFRALNPAQLDDARRWLQEQGLSPTAEGSTWTHPSFPLWAARLDVENRVFRADLMWEALAKDGPRPPGLRSPL